MLGGVSIEVNGKVVSSQDQLARHFFATHDCEPLIAEISKPSKSSANISTEKPKEVQSNENSWRPLTKEVITNGQIVVKNGHGVITVEFGKRLDYPSLWVDGKRLVYSQDKSRSYVSSDRSLYLDFQFGNTLEVRHSNGVEEFSLKGWTSAWKQAEGYTAKERPQWHKDMYK